MTRWLLAAVHLLALGVGLGAVWARNLALQRPLDREGLRATFRADTWWGLAAFLWLSTGLIRLLAGLEKPLGYYLENHLFWGKMTLLLLILVLEVGPMSALIRWRVRVGKGEDPDTGYARRYAGISRIQAILVVLMVLLATGMARGVGLR